MNTESDPGEGVHLAGEAGLLGHRLQICVNLCSSVVELPFLGSWAQCANEVGRLLTLSLPFRRLTAVGFCLEQLSVEGLRRMGWSAAEGRAEEGGFSLGVAFADDDAVGLDGGAAQPG